MSGEGKYILVDITNDSTRSILIDQGLKSIADTETTIEKPHFDVRVGVEETIRKLEEKTSNKILKNGTPSEEFHVLFSSSASGGLHMVVAGLMSMISGESAQRAALGAGALLMDQFSQDDPRPYYKRVYRLRSLKPDIFLLAGGVDGGAVDQVLDMADLVYESDMKSRYDSGHKLPIIYAGNIAIRDEIRKKLSSGKYAVRMVDNVRPLISKENLGPAREEIYDAYMEHVLIHSPGFEKLLEWTTHPILPSQAAIGKILYSYALRRGVNLLSVDLGGETTDIYSVYNGIFNRSLNADYGITYGGGNIMKTAGIDQVLRWIPVEIDERTARNLIGNMMIKPNRSLSRQEKLLQGALSREAIKLGLEKHKKIATRLKGTIIERTLGDMFEQAIESTHIVMERTNTIIGRGKVFQDQSPKETALILLDALESIGFTELIIDKTAIMPQLGSLHDVEKETALDLLETESLKSLGTCIAPKGDFRKNGKLGLSIRSEVGEEYEVSVKAGEIRNIPLENEQGTQITVEPSRRMDFGSGRGKQVTRHVFGGSLGLIVDLRGRPLRKYRSEITPVIDMGG
jgi:hypothetical protein